jgi:ketosteroid isomerase-like protein
MSDPRIRLAADFFQKYFAGDVGAACELLDPNVVYLVPGKNPASGTFHGISGVAKHLATFLRLTEDPIDVLQWEDWMGGVDHTAGLARIHLQRAAQQEDFRLIFLLSVTGDEARQRISRIEAFVSDEAAFDRFLSVQA